ncbi:conserved hypothetical protein [Bradyrhizobium sp. ORS 375]|uniref:hypothetical protein n=1 Tax=Bradyrhizobium sp. (strain ORS 375) TaxID=566679 RepID=UPI000240A1E3|nr:hypothetical protein [Bradyrhizobium sp. ORS 375]CCD94031.1 conserved hypothetical protein [Bradyrhizobium sp. ORS 375]
MSRWRRASVPSFSWVPGLASPHSLEQHKDPSTNASGFHDNATLTLSPGLTTAVAVVIAACTISLSFTLSVLSARAVLSLLA